MSNFICEHCNTAIMESADGSYITGCAHYPLDLKEPNTILCACWQNNIDANEPCPDNQPEGWCEGSTRYLGKEPNG